MCYDYSKLDLDPMNHFSPIKMSTMRITDMATKNISVDAFVTRRAPRTTTSRMIAVLTI